MLEMVFNRSLFIGEGALEKFPQVLASHQKKKVFLVVFDQSAAFVKKAIQLLEADSIGTVLYDQVKSEPDIEVIDQGVELILQHRCDAVVAIGGGSVMDAAKSIALIATNGGSAEDYQMHGRAVTTDPLFLAAVPTTAGTGAEATKVSVILNNKTGWKKSMYHNSMIAGAVFLDPAATMGLPPRFIASTGIDALTHAIESCFSLFANEVSRMYSLKALRLIVDNLHKAYSDSTDTKAHENMLLGSYLAGCAISAGTGLAHIIGQPVGALYHISHGEICSILLPGSMRANTPFAKPYLLDIAKTLGTDEVGKSEDEAIEAAIVYIEKLIASVNGPHKLTDYVSLDKIDIEAIVSGVQESMGHVKNNPRPVEPLVIRQMIKEVL
ncbi:iron-containing alcohol dehydrogenase [Oscillospiraceae bacterium MB08-C2-2]|nr:iron-containing alcohol dehydrogenase [Oscillospiraceae bacterium MB08-C2-2]